MKKSYIIIFVFMILYIAGVVIYSTVLSKAAEEFIVIGNASRWEYLNKKWKDVKDPNDIFIDRTFDVYDNSIYKGNFNIQYYNDTWYLFDQSNDSVDLNGDLFAYSGKNKIDVIDFSGLVSSLDQSDLKNLNKVMKKYKLPEISLSDLEYNQKISFDFDNDKKLETVYTISNLYTTKKTDKIFNFIYYVNGNKLQVLVEDIVDYDSMTLCEVYELSNIIDLNNDKKYELIIREKPQMVSSEKCHVMYKLKFGKYKIYKSC